MTCNESKTEEEEFQLTPLRSEAFKLNPLRKLTSLRRPLRSDMEDSTPPFRSCSAVRTYIRNSG